jgi:hypothetical protein
MPFIKVSFYDDEHERKLGNTPKYKVIEGLVKNGFTCSDADLWTYSLFAEQKPFRGFRNFEELKIRLPRRWKTIEDYFYLNNYTVRAKFPGAKYQKLTEELGVGSALALVSHIHGLTQADWDIIDVTRSKDLDFSLDPRKQRIVDTLIKPDIRGNSTVYNQINSDLNVASDGERFVEVEAKGSYVDVDRKRTISGMKADIEEKKETQRTEHNNQNLLYGVITIYSENKNVTAHSRILDPPATYNSEDDPRKVRLLSRLNFYADQLNLFSRSNYLIALVNRIRDISVIENYQSLDSQPLLNRNGEKFELPNSYTQSRTVIDIREGLGIGEVFPISSSEYFFFGFDIAIPLKLIDQNFSEILEYRCDLPAVLDLEVSAKLRTQDLQIFRIDYSASESSRDRTRAVMQLSGTLYINSSGIILGMLR